MNKVYNTVWNESTGMWVVTSELTRKGGQRPGKSSVPCWQGWLLVCFCRHSLYWRQPMTIRQLEVVEQAHPCPWYG
ncbi:ESPR domain-containing protein [Escherichia coli]|nr:ESPR domain-containing protein [Escherichia coli]